jgi:hypothetical protein
MLVLGANQRKPLANLTNVPSAYRSGFRFGAVEKRRIVRSFDLSGPSSRCS